VEVEMSVESTQRVLDRYFAEMDNGDIARLFADDVTWTAADTGSVVHGPVAVREHITALHRVMLDTQTRELAVAADTACLEGDCLTSPEALHRTPFCLVYDVRNEQISAMRSCGAVESRLGIRRATASDAQ
jgi:ketosteroid isomerase-like protein